MCSGVEESTASSEIPLDSSDQSEDDTIQSIRKSTNDMSIHVLAATIHAVRIDGPGS